jgi:hypothetical protein
LTGRIRSSSDGAKLDVNLGRVEPWWLLGLKLPLLRDGSGAGGMKEASSWLSATVAR